MCEGLFWGLENMFRVFLNIAVVPGALLGAPWSCGYSSAHACPAWCLQSVMITMPFHRTPRVHHKCTFNFLSLKSSFIISVLQTRNFLRGFIISDLLNLKWSTCECNIKQNIKNVMSISNAIRLQMEILLSMTVTREE